jgi:hypothetical protein
MNGSISTYLMCAVYNWAPKFHFSVFESSGGAHPHAPRLNCPQCGAVPNCILTT